jgi:uncharacterized membrane protein YcaP (DUF421 family)
MEWLTDILLVLGRILTILPLLLIVTLFMGKRPIGEVPVFDFIIIITLGSVAGADIAEPKVEHIPIAVAIVVIGLLQKIVSKWAIKSRKFGRLVTLEPTIVFHHGKLHVKNLRKIGYSIDNVLHLLREKDIFDLNEVEIAIVESNGKLTVMKKPNYQAVTLQDLDIQKQSPGIALPVIVDGQVYRDVLQYQKLDEKWLEQELVKRGVTAHQVFLATLNHDQHLYLTLKAEGESGVPPLYH